jgi:uncharacterized protein YndB with AHSA1/START domain
MSRGRRAAHFDVAAWLRGSERSLAVRDGRVAAVLQRRYSAPVERVWRAFTERGELARWFGDVRGELRAGGTLRAHVGAAHPVTARVLRCEPPERLGVSWWYEGSHPDAVDEVDVVLKPDGAGTSLELMHRSSAPGDFWNGVGPGWEEWLYRLSAALSDAPLPEDLSALQARALEHWQRLPPPSQTPTVSTVTARVRRRYRASPERVFDAWLDPAQVEAWMGAAARREGMGELVHVELEARVGGRFRFVYRRAGSELVQSGRYLEVRRPRRLVFSWDIALPDVERIEIEITPTADGCELLLEHVMDPAWRGDVSPATAAWASVMASIADALG